MTKLFDKTKFINNTLSVEAKKENLFYRILSIVLFAIATVPFYEFFFEFCHMLGSIVCATPKQALVQLIRMAPFLLFSLTLAYLGIYLHVAYIAKDKETRIKVWKVNGFVTIGLGAFIILYVILGLCFGKYARIVEGYLTPLFPLDMLIAGLLFIVYGYFAYKYSLRIKEKGSNLPYHNQNKNKHLRKTETVLYSFAYLFALFSITAFAYGLFCIDWTHGNIFFNIMLLLNYVMIVLFVLFFRYFYLEYDENTKTNIKKDYLLYWLILNVTLYCLYLISVQVQNEAPNLNAFAILPIEFSASANGFGLIYALVNVGGPLFLFCRELLLKNKGKK